MRISVLKRLMQQLELRRASLKREPWLPFVCLRHSLRRIYLLFEDRE